MSLITDFSIAFAPLNVAKVYQLADCSANGAVVMMSGTVREQTGGKPVEFLEYQAYEPMAMRIFEQISQQILQQWSDINSVIIHHRIGKLQIQDISVLVAVGSPHRTEAFLAAKYAIDTLKHNAPIWKKEHFADGATTWVSIGACEDLNCV